MKDFLRRALALALCAALLPLSALAGGAFTYSMTFSSARCAPGSAAEGLFAFLNMLELSGQAVIADDIVDDGFDITLSACLDRDEKTRVDMLIYGLESLFHIKSPLWNDEAILINGPALLEYAMKIYNHMDIPLQHLALLYPFVTKDAFAGVTGSILEMVRSEAPEGASAWTLGPESLEALGTYIGDATYSDRAFRIWLEAMGTMNNAGAGLTDLFESFPDYVSGMPGLEITEDGKNRTWQLADDAHTVIFSETSSGEDSTLTFCLPGFADGTDARLSLKSTKHGDTQDLHMEISLGEGEACLLSGTVEGSDLPLHLPASSPFSFRADLAGSLLDGLSFFGLSPEGLLREIPLERELHVSVQGDGESVRLVQDNTDLATIHLRTEPLASYEEPDHSGYEIDGLNFFSLYDSTLSDFISDIKDNVVEKAIPILIHAPVSSVVSLMDLLQDGGVLDLLAYGMDLSEEEEEEFEEDGSEEDDDSSFAWE